MTKEGRGPLNFASGIVKRVGFITLRDSTRTFKQEIYAVVIQVQEFFKPLTLVSSS